MASTLTFRENLIILRRRKEWTQSDLAAHSKVGSSQVISRYEQSTPLPDLGQLLALAEALSVTVAQLIGETPLPPPPPRAKDAEAVSDDAGPTDKRDAAA